MLNVVGHAFKVTLLLCLTTGIALGLYSSNPVSEVVHRQTQVVSADFRHRSLFIEAAESASKVSV